MGRSIPRAVYMSIMHQWRRNSFFRGRGGGANFHKVSIILCPNVGDGGGVKFCNIFITPTAFTKLAQFLTRIFNFFIPGPFSLLLKRCRGEGVEWGGFSPSRPPVPAMN
jgi:hypothetical protein